MLAKEALNTTNHHLFELSFCLPDLTFSVYKLVAPGSQSDFTSFKPRVCHSLGVLQPLHLLPKESTIQPGVEQSLRGLLLKSILETQAAAKKNMEQTKMINTSQYRLTGKKLKILHHDLNFNVGQLTHWEIESSIKKMKPYKAQGPDEIIAELSNDCLNKLWNTKFDSEKAFDKINHQTMFCSLQKLNIPEPLLQAIKSLYSSPMFQVIKKENISPWLQQRTGIRQGRPLGPFLVILTMHCMFYDITSQFHDPRHIKSFQGIDFKELLLADDTLILTKSVAIANSYLHLIEEKSDYFDLKLNR